MNWILIGLIAGSLIVSQHETEEQCEGRKAMIVKQKGIAKCHTLSDATGSVTWEIGGGDIILNRTDR